MSAPAVGRRAGPAAVELDRRRLSFTLSDVGRCADVVALVETEDGLHRGEEWTPVAGDWLEAAAGPLTVRIRAVGGQMLRLRISAVAHDAARVRAIGVGWTPTIRGETPAHWLYSGWQSWDPADVVPFATPRASYWFGAAADPTGAAIVAAAGSARRWATRFENRDGRVAALQVVGPNPAPAILWEAKPGEEWTGEPLRLLAGVDIWRLSAKAVGGRPRAARAPIGWLSWYHYGPWVSADDVAANATILADGSLSGLGYRYVQIDDGWEMAYGDWVPNAKFAPGLEATVRKLDAHGQVGGVWTAPFLVSASADLAASAPPDWFVIDPATGERLVDPIHMAFGPMQVLDARRPAVRRHLRDVFARLRAAGIRYFKVDFLYAGAYAGLEALNAGIKAIRAGAGKDAYILASGAPLLAVAGAVEGCRIAQDTATPIYDFELGRPLAHVFGDEVLWIARNYACRHFLSRWFQLDADVALVTGGLSVAQARQLATVVALSGGPFFASDALNELPPERLALLSNPEVIALAGGGAAVPDWEPDSEHAAALWRRGNDVIAAFNWSGPPRQLVIEAHRGVAIRDLWAREDVLFDGPRLELDLPEQGVRLLGVKRGGRLKAWLE